MERRAPATQVDGHDTGHGRGHDGLTRSSRLPGWGPARPAAAAPGTARVTLVLRDRAAGPGRRLRRRGPAAGSQGPLTRTRRAFAATRSGWNSVPGRPPAGPAGGSGLSDPLASPMPGVERLTQSQAQAAAPRGPGRPGPPGPDTDSGGNLPAEMPLMMVTAGWRHGHHAQSGRRRRGGHWRPESAMSSPAPGPRRVDS